MSSNLYLVLELQLAHFLRNDFLKYLMVSHYIYIYIYIIGFGIFGFISNNSLVTKIKKLDEAHGTKLNFN